MALPLASGLPQGVFAHLFCANVCKSKNCAPEKRRFPVNRSLHPVFLSVTVADSGTIPVAFFMASKNVSIIQNSVPESCTFGAHRCVMFRAALSIPGSHSSRSSQTFVTKVWIPPHSCFGNRPPPPPPLKCPKQAVLEFSPMRCLGVF